MLLAKNLLHPLPSKEKCKHKLKSRVQQSNSYFMDVKCSVFSHATACATILCQPTGGRTKLTEGCSFRRKPQ